MKATWAQVNGEERLLFKDPKTDDGTKKSQRGRVVVIQDGYRDGKLIYFDGLTKDKQATHGGDMLRTVFLNGRIEPDAETSLAEIRELLHK